MTPFLMSLTCISDAERTSTSRTHKRYWLTGSTVARWNCYLWSLVSCWG